MGVTPEISVAEAKKIGFRMVIYPSVALRGAISGMKSTMGKLKESGVQEDTGGKYFAERCVLLMWDG